MSQRKPRTPEEQLRALMGSLRLAEEVAEGEVPIERVHAGIRILGGDPDAIGDRGAELVERLLREQEEAEARAGAGRVAVASFEGEHGVARVVPLRRRSRVAVWGTSLLAAAIVVAIGVVGAMTIAKNDPKPEPYGPSPSELAAADLARLQAQDACDSKAWTLCKEKLDEAAMVDPTGEGKASVKAERAAIAAGLVEDQKKEEERKRREAEAGPDEPEKRPLGSGK